MENFNFKQWLEMAGTGAVFDPKKSASKEDWQWWGTPQQGVTATPKEGPIQSKTKKKGKNA